MDPVLTSVLQTNRIGSDGFVWWIGQIESSSDSDKKHGGRFRVRIVGEHLKSCDVTPTEELPWAQSMMPLTHPYSDGGTTGGSVNLQPGNWVLGFFLDPVEKQKPMIMGSIAHTPGSTVVKNEDPTPGEDGCKSFTTFTQPNVKPTHHEIPSEPGQVNPETGADTSGGTTKSSLAHIAATKALKAATEANSETNTGGTKVCVTVANPKCGTESKFDKSLKNIISEMLAANSGSSSTVGNNFVSGANGFLYDQTSIARYHIGRVNRLVTSLMGRVQSEMIKYIRMGIEWIVKTVLGLNVPEEQAKQVPLDPEATHEKTRPEGNILKRVKKTLDKLLESLGCSIEDIIQQLTEWLTDLLFNYLMEVFSPAVCFITDLVEGVLNHIMGLIDGLINMVLGPLESIMSIIGGAGGIMGNVFSSVMSFLGITCSGPDAECKENVCVCNDGSSCEDEEEEEDKKPDWLDKLIGEIEEGDTGDRFVCDDAKDYLDEKNTNITFVGGVPQAPLPTIPTRGSTPPGSIGNVPTPDSFFPPTAVDPANDPSITPPMPDEDDPDDIIDAVNDYMDDIASGGDGTGNGTGDGSFEDGYDDGTSTDEDDLPELPIDVNGNRYYSVVADPDYVYDTETITFTVYTSNVPEHHQLNYTLSGTTITEDTLAPGDPNQDDDNNALTGTFGVIKKTVVTDQRVNSEGVFEDVDIVIGATPIQVTIADDAQTLAQQKMKFTLHETVSGIVPLNGFTISQSGTGYSVADAYLTTTTGSGVGLTINVTEVDADGKITGATIDAPGFGYLIGETVSISGGNDDSVITIDAIDSVMVEHANTEITIAGNMDSLLYPDGVSTSTLVNYQVSADKSKYNEGEDVVMTINTQNVPDGTKGEYLIYGDVTANDLVQDSLSGKFVVRNNTAVVTIGLLDDLDDENDESLYFTIVGYDATEVVTINGTYVAPTISTEPDPPALDRPTAGDPITDPRGSIISIPIDNKGDPYYEPPKVLITGAGYGATGIALLDASGYVSEIRVTRGGLNYKENLPSSSDVRCIIDSFTMIAPGIRYETVPKVYVDGETGVAKAVIDNRGMVVSVQILDRTIIYDHTPKIVIVGGGGMGAFAMPSMVCLSEEDLEAAKYVKIGTGKYIDCP